VSARTDGCREMTVAGLIVGAVQAALQRTEVRNERAVTLHFRPSEAPRPVRCIVEQAVRVLNGDIASVRWFHEGETVAVRVMIEG
jgi:hypothetical protein